METKLSTLRIVAFTVVVVAAILGVSLGSITNRYEVIVQGVLGIAVMYLVFKVLGSSKEDSIETTTQFRKSSGISFLYF
jgi:hypothetical protein